MNRRTSELLASALVVFLLGACASDDVEGEQAEPNPVVAEAGRAGDACEDDSQCETGLCDLDMPGGLCTSYDCDACPDGTQCARSPQGLACFQTCSEHGECRSGYQCFRGACVPQCSVPADCGSGHLCTDGFCEEYKPVFDGRCDNDGQCPTQICLLPERTCSKACTSSAVCADGEHCVLRLYSRGGNQYGNRPVCSPPRNGAALGASCTRDEQCASGMCHLGICTELCEEASCPGALTCQTSQHPTDYSLEQVKVCLPARGLLESEYVFRNLNDMTQPLPVPQNAASFSIVMQSSRPEYFTGVVLLDAPDGKRLYTTPQTTDAFYQQPVRYYPDFAISTMQVPNTPDVPLQRSGSYGFAAVEQSDQTNYVGLPRVKLFHKLAPGGEVTSGTLHLNFHLASSQGHPCTPTPVNAANAATTLKPVLDDIRRIFGRANITIGQVTYRDLTDAGLQNIDSRNESQMGSLFSKSAGTVGRSVNVFLVRSLAPEGVLGVAGGVPGPPVHGTANSGVVATWAANCHSSLGNVLAHEIGHYLGLFHNLEEDRIHEDPISDTDRSRQNLMYWRDHGGEELSPGQRFVILRNPLVE